MMQEVIKELEYWYALYTEGVYEAIDDVRMEELWIQLYESNKSNADYALGYALFMIGIDDIGDYIKASKILEPFVDDPRCAIVRCESLRWYLGNEREIEKYDLAQLLANAKTRQEKSLLYYYKSLANPQDRTYIDKSLSMYPYNVAILSLIRRGEEKRYKEIFLDSEKFFLNLCRRDNINKCLFYKPYLYQNMGLVNISWVSTLERRKYWEVAKQELPPIDLTECAKEKYFWKFVDQYKDCCSIIVDGKLI